MSYILAVMAAPVSLRKVRTLASLAGVAVVAYLVGCALLMVRAAITGGTETAIEQVALAVGPLGEFIGRLLTGCCSLLVSVDTRVRFDDGILTTLAQIEGVIAGIAIPLSLNMVARISERYQSEVVTEHFRGIRAVKYFPWYILASLLLTVAVLLWDGQSPWTRVADYVVMLLFVGACGWLLRFLQIMQKHSDSRYLLRKFNEAARSITRV